MMKKTTKQKDMRIVETITLDAGDRIPAVGSSKSEIVGPGVVEITVWVDGGRDCIILEGCSVVANR
jgi:hypothetical protein